jgi:hypothetical protein
MALTPPVRQAGVPSTPLPSGQIDSLGPTALVVQPSDYIPPPWSRRWEENIWCSPVDVVMGRLFPLMPCALIALMVVPSARIPEQDGTLMPSKGGREGIVETGGHCPEANCRNASFLFYSYRRKGNNTPKPSMRKRDNFYRFFKRANGTMATSPPLIIGDSLRFLSPKTQ